jgi:5-methylcytosine-specific restriction endonuclease McrA
MDCGNTFNAKDRRCGPCRYAHAKANSKGPCSQCEQPATVRGMCITHYTYEHRAKNGRVYTKHTKDCGFCKAPFQTATKGTAYCSLECAQRKRAGWSTSKEIVLYVKPRKAARPQTRQERAPKPSRTFTCGSCRVCGELFVALRRDVTCSKECSLIRKSDVLHAKSQRRRAKKRDAYVAPVFRKKVFEADGYRCHICNKMTLKTAVFPHPKAPTIDHLIPLSKGGTHEPINCRTAHFMCNSIKSDRLGGDQLLLFAI